MFPNSLFRAYVTAIPALNQQFWINLMFHPIRNFALGINTDQSTHCFQFPDHITVQDVTNEMLPPSLSSSSSTSLPTVQLVSSPAPAATSTIAVTPVVSRSSSSSVTPSNAAGMQVTFAVEFENLARFDGHKVTT